MIPLNWPKLGCGVGLRNEHYEFILREQPSVDWFEAISENFMDSGGRPLRILEKIRERYPVVLHGTSLSIASCDPLDFKYLQRLKNLAKHIEPSMISDHLCWSGVGGQRLHDLLPVPYTKESLRHVVKRIQEVQDFLGRRILMENVSTYVTYKHSEMPEWEFLSRVVEEADCGILLDLNNIYVNAFNHEFDAVKYLDAIPGERIGQFHLAGHTDYKEYLFDTHSDSVIPPVWTLYQEALKRWGKISTLIEWDEKIPEFSRLQAEAQTARSFYETAKAKESHFQPYRDRAASPKCQVQKITPHSKRVLTPIHPNLLEVQQWFKSKIQPEGLAQDKPSVEIELNLQKTTPGIQRLKVYSDGYLGRMHEALSEAYEAVKRVLGESWFIRLTEDYAKTIPSEEYNLSLAGRHLPAFLKSWEKTRDLPFFPDLAGLEWRVSESFHAFDEPSLEISRIAAMSEEEWANAVFEFQPSMKLICSEWPVLDIWKARKLPVDRIQIDMVNRPQQVLVYRKGVDVFCEALDLLQFEALEAFSKGWNVERVCDRLSDSDEVGGEAEVLPISQWMADWFQKGLVWRIRTCHSSAQSSE